jgi:hypothetical protein
VTQRGDVAAGYPREIITHGDIIGFPWGSTVRKEAQVGVDLANDGRGPLTFFTPPLESKATVRRQQFQLFFDLLLRAVKRPLFAELDSAPL